MQIKAIYNHKKSTITGVIRYFFICLDFVLKRFKPSYSIQKKTVFSMIYPAKFKYTLVIATLHDDGDLELCLDSLVELKSGPTFEVVIIDQNQDNRLVEVVARFSDRLTITHEKVLFRSASRARNRGAELAKGLWVGFPDDDCQFFSPVFVFCHRCCFSLRDFMSMSLGFNWRKWLIL